MIFDDERAKLRETLQDRIAETGKDRQGNLELHQIYGTFWHEWQSLGAHPIDIQRDLKIEFLKLCLEFVGTSITVWDDASQQKVPYHKLHQRDIDALERKITRLSPWRAVQELDAFMYNMRLKGEGLGVV